MPLCFNAAKGCFNAGIHPNIARQNQLETAEGGLNAEVSLRGEGTCGKIQHTVAEGGLYPPSGYIAGLSAEYVLAEYGGAGYEAVFAGKAAHGSFAAVPMLAAVPVKKGWEQLFQYRVYAEQYKCKGYDDAPVHFKGHLISQIEEEIVKAYARDAKEKIRNGA